jgi:rhodanese-related sulfurtransferase
MGSEKVLVINVLAAQYADDCRIKGTIAVSLDKLEAFVESLRRDVKIIVYCAHYQCPKSEESWRLLKKLGFTNCFAYEGGIREWFQKGYPCEGACQLSYLREESRKPMREKNDVRTVTAEELKKMLNL